MQYLHELVNSLVLLSLCSINKLNNNNSYYNIYHIYRLSADTRDDTVSTKLEVQKDRSSYKIQLQRECFLNKCKLKLHHSSNQIQIVDNLQNDYEIRNKSIWRLISPNIIFGCKNIWLLILKSRKILLSKTRLDVNDGLQIMLISFKVTDNHFKMNIKLLDILGPNKLCKLALINYKTVFA